MFPDTPQTLLKKIAELANGDDAAEWEEFVELYTQPLRKFVRTVNRGLSSASIDDIIQEVFIRLVDVLRQNKIDRTKAKFRSYLASMARRMLIDRYRESLVRPTVTGGDLDLSINNNGMCPLPSASQSVVDADPGLLFDAHWRLAVHSAAIEHVLGKTAASRRSKAIYAALQGIPSEYANLTPHEIAVRFGVSYDVVKQVKSRFDRAVAAVEVKMTK